MVQAFPVFQQVEDHWHAQATAVKAGDGAALSAR
jgi:hypothetical protein